MTELFTKQIELENNAYQTSLDKYESYFSKAVETGSIAESKEVILIIKSMIDALSSHIDEYYKLPLRGRNRHSQLFLKELAPNPRDLAFFLITTVLAPLFKGSQKVITVSKAIVKGLRQNQSVKNLQKKQPKLHSYIENTNNNNVGKIRRQLIMTARNIDNEESAQIALGTNCIDIIIGSGCDLLVIYKEGSTNILEFSEQTRNLILRSKVFFGSLLSLYYPLIVEPKDLDGLVGGGGYWSYDNINFIKLKSKKDMDFILDKNVDITRLLGVVNDISKTPYRVNKRILNIINTIIKHRLVDVRSPNTNPILYGNIPYMDTLVAKELIVKEDYGKLNDEGRFVNKEDKCKWIKALKEQELKIMAIGSKSLQYKLALQIANRFKDYEKIWFTYQADFRGRLYPLQQYLHPQTGNNIKPLLEFGTGCVLDERGLYWLKIQGANCYGYDKLTYQDRISKIDNMVGDIKKIAIDPIGNLRLWYEADSPLQFLAFCFSYNDYLNDPTTPIHTEVALDATCSGLQVYSGLLMDAAGAKSVNVINSDDGNVSDIYQKVADLDNKSINLCNYPKEIVYTTKDGITHADRTVVEARSIAGKITRKLTKRNVMTQPYSVTERGMYQQVYDLLTEYENTNNKFWEGEKFIVAQLISKLNATSISKIVKSASIGQTMIKALLRESLRERDEAYWQAPIYGFPILQRIYVAKIERLRTPLGRLVLYHPTTKVHYMRMLNGIAPNFIHSLDVILILLTVELCKAEGVNRFWLIHDSYGVLPNDVDILNRNFRKAYVMLFESKPLLQWVQQILPSKVDEVEKVMVNDLDLKQVLDSNYIIC